LPPSARATAVASPEVLMMDGEGAGVYLGGRETWEFAEGISWDAWILWEQAPAAGGDMVLFRLVSNEEVPGRESVVTETVLRAGKVVVIIGGDTRRQEAASSQQAPKGVWTHVHVSHVILPPAPSRAARKCENRPFA